MPTKKLSSELEKKDYLKGTILPKFLYCISILQKNFAYAWIL